MAERLIDKLREFLRDAEGREVSLKYLRDELRIDPTSPAYNGIRGSMRLLVNEKIVKPTGRNDGTYKVIKQVKPVKVFGTERKKPVELCFPRDFNTQDQFAFASDIVIREGDLILISGQSNQGKTAVCLNFCGENINSNPVLMGNEYTTIDGHPAPRFISRLDTMDWIEWVNGDESEKFVLLPVRQDYAEHIVKDKINIIDWINLDANSLYSISAVMEDIKRELGKGIGIIAIQKSEGSESGRGGQFTKDFADVELLIDKFGDYEVIMKIGKVKEYNKAVTGRAFVYMISKGVKIINFREVIKCKTCHGKGWVFQKPCKDCSTKGWTDKDTDWETL